MNVDAIDRFWLLRKTFLLLRRKHSHSLGSSVTHLAHGRRALTLRRKHDLLVVILVFLSMDDLRLLNHLEVLSHIHWLTIS